MENGFLSGAKVIMEVHCMQDEVMIKKDAVETMK